MLKLNPAFWRAVHSLTHPVSLCAIVLLIIKDHWLRYHYPSWLTGKLGDCAWLILAPFIAALLFALLPPLGQSARRVALASLLFIGLWFALAKTTPLVHRLTTETLYMLVDWRGSLHMDVTDLLALPSLYISWRIWQNAPQSPFNLRPLAYVALGLGLFGTLASDSYIFHDKGVVTICAINDALYLNAMNYEDINNNSSSYDWVSYDGGLTWSNVQKPMDEVAVCSSADIVRDPTNPQIQYRWVADERIERSVDGGQTWQTDYTLSYVQEDVRPYLYYRQYDEDYNGRIVQIERVPVSAILDPKTGNILFAMSWYGILVRLSSGIYEWVGVSLYGIENLLHPDRILGALFYELWLAAMLPFLIITTSTAYMRRARFLRKLWLAVGWLGWLALAFYFLPMDKANMKGMLASDWYVIGAIGLGLLVFVALPLSIGAVYDVTYNFPRAWRPLLLAGFGTGLLYLLPLVAWSQGIVPNYRTANLFALLLTACVLYTSRSYLLPILQNVSTFSKKKKKMPTLDEQDVSLDMG